MNGDWRKFYRWSFSKSGQWATCRRQFYYQNIKKHDRDEEGSRVKQLAGLTSFKMLAGTTVHQALSNQLAAAAAGGRASASLAKRFAERRFKERFGSKTPTFIEEVNGLPSGPGEKEEALESILRCIDNFFEDFWPQIATETYMGSDQGLPIRTSIGGADVYLSIDYLSLDGPFMVIRDWKTGAEKRAHAVQVAVYALHVQQKHLRSIENMRAELVYLLSPKSVIIPLSASQMEQVREWIVSESMEILAC